LIHFYKRKISKLIFDIVSKVERRKMPRKRSKQLKKKPLCIENNDVDSGVVTNLALLNNNVSSYLTDDEIHEDCLKIDNPSDVSNSPSPNHSPQNSGKLTPLAEHDVPPVKKKIQLKSSKKLKKMKYYGSKFERNHDTRSLDKFFFRKVIQFSQTPIKVDEEVSFRLREEHLEKETENDDVEEILEESILEEIVDLDDFFPSEVGDLELADFDTSISSENLDLLVEKFSRKQKKVDSKDHEEDILFETQENVWMVENEEIPEYNEEFEEHFRETLELAFDLLEVFFLNSESVDQELQMFLRALSGGSNEQSQVDQAQAQVQLLVRDDGLNVQPGL